MDQRHPFGIKVSLLALLLSGTPALAIPNPYPSPYAQPMPGQTLLFPSAGVVCDQPAQRCFDSMGLSLGLTRQYFGAFAEQNAQRDLGGRRPAAVFSLSNGSRCDVRQLTCWSGNDFGQPSINRQLTSQLFGGMPGPNPDPSPQPAPSGYTGQCRLMRGISNVFNGACALNEERQGYQPRFEVQFQNGPRYVFEQSGGGYQIADGMGGRWPVQFSDNGRSGQFRWADMVLQVTQNNYRPESNPNARMGRAIGNLLIDLFN
ncbi:MAG: hypothetical protein FJ078_00730 [Cyanobacteria bacterium K_DeepCast_35m_m2_155]|nr:hypothetical protein [Cyanobacteria bacterium K_DeepCast_35m_m2_155]